MFSFSKRSKNHLEQLDADIRIVLEYALKLGIIDFAVIESVRSEPVQNSYFVLGKSKVKWPKSKHNVLRKGDKAKAADVVPVINGSISWKESHCVALAHVILTCAKILGKNIRWGGNWDQDGEPLTDQVFQDLVHYERGD